MFCSDVIYSSDLHTGDDIYDWVTTIMYESTTLDTKGSLLVLLAVPFESDGGYRCDVCEFDPPMNPCTDFDSPIDIVDCDGNLCSEYDYCATIESVDLTSNPKAVTPLDWTMCPRAKSNPYLYKGDIDEAIEPYWLTCANYIVDEEWRESYWN